MADDITTVLIRVIQNNSGKFSTFAQARADVHGGSADVLSTTANWAGILGTAAGPLSQAAASEAVESITSYYAATMGFIQASGLPAWQQSGLLRQAAEGFTEDAAAATLLSTGVVAGLVLAASAILGILAGSGTNSAQTDLLNKLAAEFKYIRGLTSKTYWDSLLGPTGTAEAVWLNVHTYTDRLNNEGTIGYDVQQDEPYYDTDSFKYVSQFYGGMNWEDFWLAPAPEPAFQPPQAVAFINKTTPWFGFFWYGQRDVTDFDLPSWPSPSPAGDYVRDPATALPWFSLGLNAYLTLESLRNIIKPADPITFQAFLEANGNDLNQYLSFLYQQYSIAVTGHDPSDPSASLGGIAKTAYPSWDDISAAYDGSQWVNGLDAPGGIVGPGDAWNGVYGVVATYPSYASHALWPNYPWWPGNISQMPWWPSDATIDPVEPESDNFEVSSPSYFISLLNPNWPPDRSLVLGGGADDWVIPWVQNKVTLGAMARWKALYLINGYDSVWQLIRRLQDLVKPYVPSQELTQVPPVLYLDDGTIADGNWSARELCSVLQMPTGVYGGFSLNVFYYWGQVGGPGFAAYSVNRLLHFLDAISGLPLQGSSEWLDLNAGRPLSFRALLAACDDESYSLPLTAGG